MTRRIIVLAMFVVGLALVALLIPAALAIRSDSMKTARLELQREASEVASSLSPNEDLRVANLVLVDNGETHLVAIYTADGKLADGQGPATADPPVWEALAGTFSEATIGVEEIATVPVPRPDGSIIALRIAEQYPNPEGHALRRIFPLLLVATAIILLAAGLEWLLARQLIRPIARLQRAAVAIGNGQFDLEVPTTGLREMDDLGDAVAKMAAQISRQVERERAFSTQVSHQLRTPIAAMRVAIETEQHAPRNNPGIVLEESIESLDRLERTVNELLLLTRGQPRDRALIELATVVEDARNRWRPRFDVEHRRVTCAGRPAEVETSRSAIDHILDVLLDNALVHGSGTVSIEYGAQADTTFVTVSDEAEIVRDPFSVPARQGHGIGLKLARTLAEVEGASLSLDDAVVEGHRFVLTFGPTRTVHAPE